MSRPVMRRNPEPKAAPTEDSTKAEIAEYLEEQGIETTTRATKAELLDLVE